MINSSKTFPSAAAGLPHKNQPNYLEVSKQTPNVVSIGGYNPFVAFRTQYRDMEHKRAMDGVRQNAINAQKWNTQSTKQGIVNIPAGSFNRGANLNSGNSCFSCPHHGGAYGGAYHGGVRTQQGSAYVRDLLQKRAQQFDAIRALKEGAPAVVEAAQPQPLSKDEASQVAIDLLIQTIQTSFLEGNYDEIKTEDIRKLFGSLRAFGFQIAKDTLLSYYDTFGKMINDIKTLRAEHGDKRLDIDDLKKVNDVLLNKVYYLLEALLAGYELSPKQQKLFLSSAVKEINKIKPQNLLEGILDKPLPKSKLGSRAKPSKKQQTITSLLQNLAEKAEKSAAEKILKEVEDEVKSVQPSPIKTQDMPDLPPTPKKETKKKKRLVVKDAGDEPESKAEPVSIQDEVRILLSDIEVIGDDLPRSSALSVAKSVKEFRSRASKVNSTLVRNAFFEALGRLSDPSFVKEMKSAAGIRGRA